MSSWADRVRQAELEDLEVLDAPERLDFESLLQWLRLSFLATPALVLLAFGTAALAYAIGITIAVVASFAWISLLTRFYPTAILRWQLYLRILDCGLVYIILV